MDQDSPVWVRDKHGRIGELLEAGKIRYASGEQRRPDEYTVISDVSTAQYEFAKQRDAMWKLCCEMESLNRSVLSRCVRFRQDSRPGSLLYEELLADVGVKTLRRAALLYVAERCGESIRGYMSRCLKRAYTRALNTKDPGRGRGTTKDSDNTDRSHNTENHVNLLAPSSCSGLEVSDQLLTIVEAAKLTRRELDLLLSRYDSDESLRVMAKQMGVYSPQTVLNSINRILERCRRAV